MISNSEKLDSRTKQHTQFGVSASNGSRDMAQTKSWQKKRKKKKKKRSELDGKEQCTIRQQDQKWRKKKKKNKQTKKEKRKKKNEHEQNHIASPTGIANETGSWSPCMRPRSDPPNFGPIERGEKQTNDID